MKIYLLSLQPKNHQIFIICSKMCNLMIHQPLPHQSPSIHTFKIVSFWNGNQFLAKKSLFLAIFSDSEPSITKMARRALYFNRFQIFFQILAQNKIPLHLSRLRDMCENFCFYSLPLLYAEDLWSFWYVICTVIVTIGISIVIC